MTTGISVNTGIHGMVPEAATNQLMSSIANSEITV
jgi:hypothetical protein